MKVLKLNSTYEMDLLIGMLGIHASLLVMWLQNEFYSGLPFLNLQQLIIAFGIIGILTGLKKRYVLTICFILSGILLMYHDYMLNDQFSLFVKTLLK